MNTKVYCCHYAYLDIGHSPHCKGILPVVLAEPDATRSVRHLLPSDTQGPWRNADAGVYGPEYQGQNGAPVPSLCLVPSDATNDMLRPFVEAGLEHGEAWMAWQKALAAAPAVQAEPVAWLKFCTTRTSMPGDTKKVKPWICSHWNGPTPPAVMINSDQFFWAPVHTHPDVPAPIDMILHCPECGLQHVDKANTDEVLMAASERGFDHGSADWQNFVDRETWDNPPHRSHLCARCGHVWRPADVPTNGVAAIKTKGQRDSPPVEPAQIRRGEYVIGDAVVPLLLWAHRMLSSVEVLIQHSTTYRSGLGKLSRAIEVIENSPRR